MASDKLKDQPIYTVSRLNQAVKQLLLDSFATIYIQGEITGLSRAASGHLYFALKDRQCEVRCVMFQSQAQSLRFQADNGLQVIASAKVDMYTLRGSFQLNIRTMRLEQKGDLQRQLEELKKQLLAEGLFAQERKQTLVRYPSRIGIVTSQQGAALHDILTTMHKRWRLAEIFIYPAAVQGENAVSELCEMIKQAEQNDLDVLILARGGGSLQDLAAFNSKQLAYAMAACQVPIVTGLGHETDFSIADMVADQRAPTPTGAVYYAAPEQTEIQERIAHACVRLRRTSQQQIRHRQQHLLVIYHRLWSFHPQRHLESMMQFCDETKQRLYKSLWRQLCNKKQNLTQTAQLVGGKPLLNQIHTIRQRLALLHKNLYLAMQHRRQQYQKRFHFLKARQQTLSPYATMARGYAIVRHPKGKIITSARQIKPAERLNIEMHDGYIEASSQKIRRK